MTKRHPAVGIALPDEAVAGSGAVNPVQTSTYLLGASNPITFGAATQINALSNVGVYGGSGQSWTVANYGSIQGQLDGIHLVSPGSTVTNWGTIIGSGTSIGVLLQNGGSVTNQSGGSISGYVGVAIGGAGGTVTNAGSISAGETAVFVASGSLDNESGGTLSMTTSGLSTLTAYVGGGGSVSNAGTITNAGYNTAAVVLGDGGRVTNSGTISTTGVLDSAVYTLKGGTVTNSGRLLVSADSSAGVIFLNGGALDNTGTIEATGSGNAGVYLVNGGTVTNSSTITATATSGIGVGSEFAGTIDNLSGGTISGAVAGVLIGRGTGSVTNGGEIRATTGFGVNLMGGGGVSNKSGGTISGVDSGVYVGGGSAATNLATNAGTISGTGTNSTGLNLASGGAVTNQSGGTISGVAHGVFLAGGASLLSNAGNIYGTAPSGSAALLNAGGSVTNTGKISGGAVGVFIVGGAGAATNSGSITGTSLGGVVFVSGGSVTNQSGGTISGANLGVEISGGSGAANKVTNAGSITGAGTNSVGVILALGGAVTNLTGGAINGGADGVYIEAAAGTVTNAGTIGGKTASVVFAGPGANTLTLETGSTLKGGAYGSTASGATNALILQGQGTASNNFANFNTLTADASGIWTLGGNSGFGDTTVSTGTLSVTGSLTSATLEIQASAQLTDAGDVSVYDSVTNSGHLTINGVTMHVADVGGTFTQLAGGNTTLLNGGALDPSNILVEQGVISLANGGEVSTGSMELWKGSSVHLGGTGDQLLISGNLSGSGAVTIGSSGVVDIGGSASSLAMVIFNDGDNDVLRLGDPLGFASTIKGFQSGDSIDLANTLANGFTYSKGLLDVTENGVAVANLGFTGHYTQSQFSIATDGHGGALLTVNTGAAMMAPPIG